jgi:hypothetical protein
MHYDPIIIRPAEMRDIQGIWHLLHTDHQAWSNEKICNELPALFVLTYQERIISVFHGVLESGNVEEFWIVTHPFYLKSSVEVAMKNMMISILGYQVMSQI